MSEERSLEIDNVPAGWDLYFEGDSYTAISGKFPIDGLISLGKELIKECVQNLDGQELCKFTTVELPQDAVEKGLCNIGCEAMLIFEPYVVLRCFGLATWYSVLERILDQFKDNFDERDPSTILLEEGPLRKFTVRIIGNSSSRITRLRKIKASSVGKFVFVQGTVVRVSNGHIKVERMQFKCAKCHSTFYQAFKEDKYVVPTKCQGGGCRSRSFIPLKETCDAIDCQLIKIQEVLSDAEHEAGRVPRTVEAELCGNLVDRCSPGDVVTISGVVHVTSEKQTFIGNRKDANARSMFLLYIVANNILNNKKTNRDKSEEATISKNDLRFLQHVATDPNCFRLIVNSICPSIYGQEIVKAGIALCLFGGRQKYGNESQMIAVRGDCHCLIVGDPGLGKSQMLQAASLVAPRGVFVCGSYASSSGLTVTLHKEKGSSDYSLEAGALVLSDQGICCIDEFDKMGNEHSSLLEAMEQQSISIAKAGIVCALPARASVIAAANPVGGHYTRSKTVAENLKINRALLSRFDLIFILLDKPDACMDLMLSEHVMQLHTVEGKQKATKTKGTDMISQYSQSSLSGKGDSLMDKLKVDVQKFDPIPSDMLRKYITYARKFADPVMTPEAGKVLKDFYIKLRQEHTSMDSTPITTRQLESLIRLSEARARLELNDVITVQHAKDVVEIMQESLNQTYEDQYGYVDFTRSNGMSNSAEAKRFINLLRRERQTKGVDHWSYEELYAIATKASVRFDKFRDFLEALNVHDLLLKHGNRQWAL